MKLHSACLKKRAYGSYETACEVATRRSAATGLVIVPYACEVGHFHIGKAAGA